MESNFAERLFGNLSHLDIDPDLAWRFGITIIVIAVQALVIWLVLLFFGKLAAMIKSGAKNKIKPLVIKKARILSVKQIENVLLFFLRIMKFLVIVFQLFISLPIIFSFHPATAWLSSTIFGYILSPLRNVLSSFVEYIPNFITIIIFILITRYVIKALRFFAKQISSENLVLPGFYADWAWPTFHLLRVLLIAFAVAIIYPYLPGSDSRIFQGVSVFVGILFSFGSSSAIGNLVAGLVITYMRPFKVGDRIKIKDITGYVVEKSPFVVRLKNIKNENITLPNLTVLNSDVINYNTFGEHDGLILHVDVTMGYDVPWRQVYDVLVRAASKTPHIEENPKPFVHQKSLDDFSATYEINVYTKEINRVPLIYSLLYQHIQDEFIAEGISLFIPHIHNNSVNIIPPAGDGNGS